jgi:hypothetical protein
MTLLLPAATDELLEQRSGETGSDIDKAA